VVGKVVAGIVGGFVVAAFAANILNLVAGSTVAGFVLIGSWVLALVLAIRASSGARAWRWLLICAGALSFLVPLATLMRTTRQTDGVEVLGGIVATGIFAVVFFLLGLAFLVIGFAVGRDKTPGSTPVTDA